MKTDKKPSRTDLMIRAVLAAPEHRLEIGYFDSDKYERLIRSARQFHKLPEGKDLQLEKDWREQKVWIEMVDQPAWKLATLEPIAVPEQLRKPSDVITELRNRADFRIRHTEKSRALRLIEALVRESRQRGYRVEATDAPRSDQWGVRNTSKDHGHFVIRIKSDDYRLTMIQEEDRVKHEPRKTEQGRGWYPKYDQVTSDRLRLTIEGHSKTFRSSVWSDKPTRKLEDMLPEILHEVELRAEHAEQQRLDEIRRYEERKRQWNLAREAAVVKLNEAHRAAILSQQVEDWEFAQRITSYLQAVEDNLSSRPEQLESPNEWLEWIRGYVERLNPLSSNLSMPADPKATSEALVPHMKRWSPYGPE